MKPKTYLLLKTTGDDGSDITGCLLALSAQGLSNLEILDLAASDASDAHRSFSGMSFNVDDFNGRGKDFAGVEVHWITDTDWEEKFGVGADDDHAFISRAEFNRLKKTNEPDWRVGSTRLFFNQFGDCFFEGSYDNAHGGEESALLPMGDLHAKFPK